MDRTTSSSGCSTCGTRSIWSGPSCSAAVSGAGSPRSSRPGIPSVWARLVLVDAYGLQVDGALAADEFALTPPMLRPLVFAEPEASLAREWLPDAEPPDRVESALHARVAAARLAWQFPYCPKLRDRLARAKVPALILWGAQDQLVPPAHAHAYAASLPDARVVVVPGAGHYPWLRRRTALPRRSSASWARDRHRRSRTLHYEGRTWAIPTSSALVSGRSQRLRLEAWGETAVDAV